MLLVGTLVVLVLFVVGISLLVGGIKRQGSVEARAQTTTAAVTPSATPSATAPGPAGDQASGMCDTNSIEVTAGTDHASYKAGSKMKLSLTVKNTSDQSCNISAGPKQQEFQIKQGDTVEWSSKYCSTGDETDADVQFPAGSSKPSKLTWDMVPADKDCQPTADTLKEGSYQLVTKLGDKTSEPADFKVTKG